MNRGTRLAALLAIAAALLSTAGCNKLRARDQLNKGVHAYKSANYEQAINHFQNAVNYDEDLKVAKLYLATAYAQQYVPGVDTTENNRMAQQAIEEYQRVLEKDPESVNSMKGIAYLYMNMKKFDDAREYYKKASAVDPNDPELYYSIGFIDWSAAYRDAAQLKSNAGLRVEDELKSKQDQKLCEQLLTKPLCREGLCFFRPRGIKYNRRLESQLSHVQKSPYREPRRNSCPCYSRLPGNGHCVGRGVLRR